MPRPHGRGAAVVMRGIPRAGTASSASPSRRPPRPRPAPHRPAPGPVISQVGRRGHTRTPAVPHRVIRQLRLPGHGRELPTSRPQQRPPWRHPTTDTRGLMRRTTVRRLPGVQEVRHPAAGLVHLPVVQRNVEAPDRPEPVTRRAVIQRRPRRLQKPTHARAARQRGRHRGQQSGSRTRPPPPPRPRWRSRPRRTRPHISTDSFSLARTSALSLTRIAGSGSVPPASAANAASSSAIR